MMIFSDTSAIVAYCGDCANGSPTWEASATTLGPTLFEPGPAQVCAMAVVKLEAGPALVEKWCKKDVELILLE